MIHNQKPWSAIQQPPTRLGQQDGAVKLSGVRWDIAEGPDGKLIEQGIFRDTYIQPERVKDVYLVIKPFTDQPGNFPGHAQLDFEFEPDAPLRDSAGNTDKGLTISMEVRFRQGESWNPVPDQQNPQPIVYQLGTMTDSVEKATVFHKYPLQRYKLEISREQAQQLLRERLETATQDHSSNLYHPVKNSCLSTLIDAVNRVTPATQQISHDEPGATVPIWANKVFYRHQLLDSPRPDQTIEVP
jgi:hypothetical protein